MERTEQGWQLIMPDGKKLATGGFDGKIRIYDAANCQLLTSFIPAPLSAGTPAGGAQ